MNFPQVLTTKAKPYYRTLHAIVEGDMEDGDEHLLGVLANTYFIHEEALAKVIERGPVIAGETMVRENPAFRVYKESEKMIESLSIHFGLSPKARKAVFKSKDDDSEDIVSSFRNKFNQS
jgi:P27 family predicted phage terminase small subunit